MAQIVRLGAQPDDTATTGFRSFGRRILSTLALPFKWLNRGSGSGSANAPLANAIRADHHREHYSNRHSPLGGTQHLAARESIPQGSRPQPLSVEEFFASIQNISDGVIKDYIKARWITVAVVDQSGRELGFLNDEETLAFFRDHPEAGSNAVRAVVPQLQALHEEYELRQAGLSPSPGEGSSPEQLAQSTGSRTDSFGPEGDPFPEVPIRSERHGLSQEQKDAKLTDMVDELIWDTSPEEQASDDFELLGEVRDFFADR